MTVVPLASARTEVAEFLGAVLIVYTLIIIIWVLTSMIFSLGARTPYSRWGNAVLDFLRDVSEPFLRIFRRLVPMVGPIDLSPIIAILALNVIGGLIVRIIHG